MQDVQGSKNPGLVEFARRIRLPFDHEYLSDPYRAAAVVKASDGKVWVSSRGGGLENVPPRRESLMVSWTNGTWTKWPLDDDSQSFLCSAWFDLVTDGDNIYSLSRDSGFGVFSHGQWQRSLPQGMHTIMDGHCSLWTAPGLPFFLATMKGLQRWRTQPAFRPIKTPAHPLPSDPNAIWASSADDAWLSTIPCREHLEGPRHNCGPGLFHFSGRGTQKGPELGCTIRAIRGTAKDDIWLVGDEGCAAHYDGHSWRRLPTGTDKNLHAVSTCSAGEAWAVGDEGTILKWDGGRWQAEDSGTGEDLLGVAGCSTDDVWAVGRGGTILRKKSQTHR